MLRLLLLAALGGQLCPSTARLMFRFIRSVNTVNMYCGMEGVGDLDLRVNTSVKIFVNRTDSVDGFQLEERAQVFLADNGRYASFTIKPNLEGYYSCGMVGSQPDTSNDELLVVLPSSDGAPMVNENIYAAGSTSVHIPCPFRPGRLQACYFGEWTKNGTKIVYIGRPDRNCGSSGQQSTNVNPSKYQVDRETFSLIISSADAKNDSDVYKCLLRVINPALNQELAFLRPEPILTTLIIDGQPTITKGPRDVVIGLNSTGERPIETASFRCAALGRPIPRITWLYITIDQDGTLGIPTELTDDDTTCNITNSDSDEDQTRRFLRTSTLTMPVTENDGGIIRCRVGTTQMQYSYKDGYLTVLSKPSINIMTTLRGEIVYDIGLNVHVYHPVMLNCRYQDTGGGRILERDRQPGEPYNDTVTIIFRENKELVPDVCGQCYVTVSVTAKVGNKLVQGPSIISSDMIDIGAKAPEQTIRDIENDRIIIGVTLGSIILLTVITGAIVIVVLTYCCMKQKQKHKDEMVLKDINAINKDVSHLSHSRDDQKHYWIKEIKEKLKALEAYIKDVSTDTDADSSGDTALMNLRKINQHLGIVLKNCQLK